MNTNAPRRPCKKAGCKSLCDGPYCSKHRLERDSERKKVAKVYDEQRGTKSERGYTSKWSRYSKAYRKANPLCVLCEKEGIMKLAQCVDHIVPIDGENDPLFWTPANHQSLCHYHHSLKTNREDFVTKTRGK